MVFGLDFLIVPSQSRMQERSPASVRGWVLALYQALFNGGSIPVVLGLGVLADLLGIVIVIYLLGAESLAGAIGTILGTRNGRERQQGHTPPPPPGSTNRSTQQRSICTKKQAMSDDLQVAGVLAGLHSPPSVSFMAYSLYPAHH